MYQTKIKNQTEEEKTQLGYTEASCSLRRKKRKKRKNERHHINSGRFLFEYSRAD